MSAQYGIPALFAFGELRESSPLHAAPTEFANAEEESLAPEGDEELSGIHGQAEAIYVLYQAGLKSA